jgi:hypothetical protein
MPHLPLILPVFFTFVVERCQLVVNQELTHPLREEDMGLAVGIR